jgi:DinB superfamily
MLRMSVDTMTFSALAAFPMRLEHYFGAIPRNRWNWSPSSWEGIPSESLTAISQICHVRDVEIDGYHVRFRRLLEESEPTLDSLDGYALVEQRFYANSDPETVLEEFRLARAETLRIIESLDPEQLLRSGYFEGYGRLTAKGLVHYLCSHDQQHLSGLQWLLGKIESISSNCK